MAKENLEHCLCRKRERLILAKMAFYSIIIIIIIILSLSSHYQDSQGQGYITHTGMYTHTNGFKQSQTLLCLAPVWF